MIKVLNIISDTNIGGAGRVIINYLKYSDRQRFETLVAMPRGSALKEPIEALGVKVYEVDGMADKSMDLKVISQLKTIIRQADPDIVHTHGSMSGRIAGRQCKKTVVFTRHSAFPVPERMKKFPLKHINKFVNEHYADAIIAVSPATAENLTDAGVSKERIDIMMNGVEAVTPVPMEERAKLRQTYGIMPGDVVFGITARIEEYKGHGDILRALRKVKDACSNVKLLIAGTGAYEGEVRRLTQELGLTDTVVFIGFVKDVAPVLSILDVQLNASFGTEASSLAMLEGFSMGIPAIASDYGGNPWQVKEGVSGLMFPARDVDKLAGLMEKLALDPALREKLGLGARREYQERFTADIAARRIEEIYTKTLEARNGAGK